MRIATDNVEWFDALFKRNANPLTDNNWSSRYNVTCADQWRAVEQVMRALDADCILVVEAPNHKTGRSTVDMLERFEGELTCAPRKLRWGLQMTRSRNWRSHMIRTAVRLGMCPCPHPISSDLTAPITLIWM